MQNITFYLIVIFVCIGCGKTTNTGEKNTIAPLIDIEKDECENLDENKIFNNEKWFLPYANADIRDSTRPIFEQWKYRLDEECELTLTLYKDSIYTDSSPCEWDFAFAGFYQYVCDTLYCVRIDIDDHSISTYNPPQVMCLEKYIKQGNILKYIWRKERISNNKFDIQQAPNEIIFDKVPRYDEAIK